MRVAACGVWSGVGVVWVCGCGCGCGCVGMGGVVVVVVWCGDVRGHSTRRDAVRPRLEAALAGRGG